MNLSLARRVLALCVFVLSPALFAAGTTITVNDSTDTIHSAAGQCSLTGTGTCSLRDAILFANSNGAAGSPYSIKFSGVTTIQLANANGGLDTILVTTSIDGTTSGSTVELDGSLLSGSPNGITCAAQCTIKGMVIHSFGGDGINLGGGSTNSLVQANYIGTDTAGTTAKANSGNGITADAPSITINSNLISGNGQTGIDILGNTTTLVNVTNNKIGTDVTGLLALGNGLHGIRIRNAAFANTIGGGNIISGNTGHGVFIDGGASSPLANIVSGNFIGTRIGGLGAIANTQDGIHVSNSNDNVLGGGPFGGNVISGNTQNGIAVDGNSDNTQILNNLIGLDGTALLANGDGNGGDGILLSSVTNTTIGGILGIASRNYISFNTGHGVHISGQTGTTTGNVVEGNYIGTNLDGSNTNSPANGKAGVFVEGSSAQNNTIGGSSSASPSRGNTIAFNTAAGIRIGVNASDTVGPVTILSNSTHDNTALGLDLGNDGVTTNGSGPTGPNSFQNYPVLTLALVSNVSGKILMKGSQSSGAAAPSEIQFFLADTDASNHGEGKTFILDQSGVSDGSFAFGPSAPASAVAAGNLATSTATTGLGTSEFSANLAFVANAIPIANAGPPQSVATGATVTLDGSASNDPDSLPNGATILSGNFTWAQQSGPAVSLTNGTTASPSFIPSTPGSYVFSLVVSDGMDVSTNSTTVTITVKSPSNTALISSANPSVFGQTVTFTATVTGTGPTATGNVKFMDGASLLGTVALNGSAQAQFPTSTLALGSHPITAVYVGDSNFNGSTSSLVNQVVNMANTTTGVVANVNPSVFGQSVTFTATVTATAPGSGTPTGNANFFDGATPLGTIALNGSGQAQLPISSLSVTTHSISVQYGGDTNFNTSTSSILSQVVNKANTTTTVISSGSPSVFGQVVTFTATVAANAPGAGTPTGNASFFDGATPLGTVALNGSGQAQLPVSSLTVTTHSITVQYGGDANFNTSTSSILSQVVNKANTTSAVLSNANPSTSGQSVTFTATVTATAPGSGTPAGNVSFFDGATPLGTVALNGSAQAQVSTSTLTVGGHSITVQYAGNASFNSSTSPILTQTVNASAGVASSTTVISSANPSVFGQAVTFTATVNGSGPIPTGTVSFFDGATPLGSSAVNGSAQAALPVSTLSVGTHSITAVYGGDSTYSGSTSSILSQAVNAASTTTSVISNFNPSSVGQSVTFTATVSPVAPGAGVPTQNVTFFDGASPLGTVALNGSGQAQLSTSSLGAGSHSITASYAGDTNFSSSVSSVLTQIVNLAAGTPTTTTVGTNVNPSVFGQNVTFTATVSGGGPTPTGTVNFMDGATLLGSAPVNGSAQAVFSTASLAVGAHSITAVYGGDVTYAGSASIVLKQNVNAANSTTTVLSSVNPSAVAQLVTFTATSFATAPGAGVPDGTMSFFDGAAPLASGVVLNASGQATFSTSALTLGSHSITATYSGSANFNGSTSAILVQTVNASASTTVLNSNPNPSFVGQTVTITATVNGSGATPTGSVTFTDGATPLGTIPLDVTGKAVLPTSSLTLGLHTITASYAGDPTYSASSAQKTQSVISVTTNIPALDPRALAALAFVLAIFGVIVMRR